MLLNVFSHCVLDTISIDGNSYEQSGGPACYCSFTAKKLKFDVKLFTKFGNDFDEEILKQRKILLQNFKSNKPTTRFQIKLDGIDRKLILTNICDMIEYDDSESDASIISPVFNEIPIEVYEKIKTNSNFVFLDPQGFLRQTKPDNEIFLQKPDLDLKKINAIKVSLDELSCLAGGEDVDAMKVLQKRGIEHVILTNKQNITLLVKDRIYSIKLPNINVYDTTGIGDIFSATFCCTMIKENDFLWALCFAGGAAQAALETKQIGLQKIPEKNAIETNGAYFYNMIKFKQV